MGALIDRNRAFYFSKFITYLNSYMLYMNRPEAPVNRRKMLAHSPCLVYGSVFYKMLLVVFVCVFGAKIA